MKAALILPLRLSDIACMWYAGQPMLVPLTGSLYVNGTVTQPDKVLLDIGTGYFIEVSEIRVLPIMISLLS